MTKKKVKLTVIIRTYNSGKFVRVAIDSVLRQTINPEFYEIVVVDDGSKDNTLDILNKYYRNDIKLIRQRHSGPVKATNKGIRKSRGQYVILLDDDDSFEPEILERMFKLFRDNKSIDFVYCDYFEKTGKNKKIVSLKKNIFLSLGCAIMFKKEIFKEVGLFDENLVFAEYDFLMRIIKNKKVGKHIPVPLYIYMRNKNSLTFNPNWVKRGIEQLRKKYGGIVKKIRKY